MSYTLDELSREDKKRLVGDMVDKKCGASGKEWAALCEEYQLECNPETLRKAGVGVKLYRDAMEEDAQDGGYMERQKIRDLTRKLNELYRVQSRSELLRETVAEAARRMPPIAVQEHTAPMIANAESTRERCLVVGIGDFHYGAKINVKGLYGETLNEYNAEIFQYRMGYLLHELKQIIEKEQIESVHVMMLGDLLDGMLRQSQLMRLEYGLVDSVMQLSEYMAQWIAELSQYAEVRVSASSGNHSEIRPLGTKAREMEDENLERIVMWYLFDRFITSTRVHVNPECARLNKVNVCGYSFVLLHGDGSESIDRISQQTVNLYSEKVDYFMCAHLHKEQEFSTGYTCDGNSMIIRVPSICGMSRYEQRKGYGGRPGAIAMVMESGYGRRCVYPIDLGRDKCL